jgi:hypothetical protein
MLLEGPAWQYELKLDGYRALAFKTGGKLSLRSRNDKDFVVRYPSIAKALTKLPDETVIDGEIVAVDEDGKPFEALQNSASGADLRFSVFDLLVITGTDVRCEALTKRRDLLEKKVVPKLEESLLYSPALDASLADLVHSVKTGGEPPSAHEVCRFATARRQGSASSVRESTIGTLMADKTVFISSTFKDLKEHRRKVWDALKKFDVSVKGMEEFGARTEGPLETCLAEVEESDVYIGILGFRLGSIDPESRKPFAVLEYETAIEQGKEILIYIANPETALFPQSVVDQDTRSRKRLDAFKEKLLEKHTCGEFSTADDLVEKLTRDFKKHFVSKVPDEQPKANEEAYEKSLTALKGFRLTPKRFNGYEVRLRVSFYGSVFPASRSLCQRFNLDYGFAIGAYFHIREPKMTDVTEGTWEIYAAGNHVDRFTALVQEKDVELYARLQFSEEDVKSNHAEFLGRHYDEDENNYDDGTNLVYVAPEGKVILLFSKRA